MIEIRGVKVSAVQKARHLLMLAMIKAQNMATEEMTLVEVHQVATAMLTQGNKAAAALGYGAEGFEDHSEGFRIDGTRFFLND